MFFFKPRGYVDGRDDYLIYMGRDKYENEELIRYGLPTDAWFHVDGLSSAHVYLRLPDGVGLDDIPPDTLEDCAQLVKQNSIQGCKANDVVIVYTPWSNLRKTPSMEVGQVGFADERLRRYVKVARRSSDILNRLERTRTERSPDLKAEKEAYEALVRGKRRAEERAARAADKAAKEEAKRAEELRSYKSLMASDNMVSNAELRSKYATVEEAEDDFM
ncbi:CCDC25 [Scenedesmus sp. PABB004]|nr:CCDC25 [Scenedesmus sp. PABB004]